MNKPVAYSGPFRIELGRVESARDARSKNRGVARLYLNVAWEPRVTTVLLAQPLAEILAEGEDGEEIKVVNPAAKVESAIGPDVTAVEVAIPLALPHGIEKLRRLKGQLEGLVAGPLEKFEFDDIFAGDKPSPAARHEQRRGGVTVVVHTQRGNKNVWAVTAQVHFDEMSPALESHRGWVFDNEAYLRGADGIRLQPKAFDRTQSSPRDVKTTYLFEVERDSKGLAFVYTVPASFRPVRIDYEFRDVPLP